MAITYLDDEQPPKKITYLDDAPQSDGPKSDLDAIKSVVDGLRHGQTNDLGQYLKDGWQAVTTPGRGMRGVAVGAAKAIDGAVDAAKSDHPIDSFVSNEQNAILRANEATKPDYTPGDKEHVASFAGDMMDPLGLAVGEGLGKAAVKVGKPIVKGLAKGVWAPLVEALTGVASDNTMRLAEQPLKVLGADSSKVSGQAFSAAKKAAGVTEEGERAVAKAADVGKETAQNLVDALRKAAADTPLNAEQLLEAKAAAGKALKSAKGSNRYFLGSDKADFASKLADAFPEVASAQDAVSLSKTKEAFQSLIPKNKSGSPAVIRVLAALGSSHFNPAAALAFMPATGGLATLGGSAAAHAAEAAASNPLARQTLVAALKQAAQKGQSSGD